MLRTLILSLALLTAGAFAAGGNTPAAWSEMQKARASSQSRPSAAPSSTPSDAELEAQFLSDNFSAPPSATQEELQQLAGAPVPAVCGEALQRNQRGLMILQMKMQEIEKRARDALKTIEEAYRSLEIRHVFGFLFTLFFLIGLNVLFFLKERRLRHDYTHLVELRQLAANRLMKLEQQMLTYDPNYPTMMDDYVEHKSLWNRWITWTVPSGSLAFIILSIILFL